MAKFFVSISGALGVTALALCFLGLVPFLSAGLTAGAGYVPSTSGFSVNREFKSDRLPIHTAALNSSAWQTEFAPQAAARVPHEIPFGCDPSFSPMASPQLADVYGRCLS
jgi:hypothetical protein